MLVPLLGPPPSYLPYFMHSALRSAQLVDYLLFHEGQEIPWGKPANVKVVDLGKGGLAELVGLKLGEEYELPLRNATVLLRSLRLLFEKWPRLIAEYKPAFGRVFEDFLQGYSHWGYCDVDMVMGNLPFFFERHELTTEDIVTYSYGDAEALYLRGQWTVHKNLAHVNGVWRQCAHLGDELQREVALKMAHLRQAEAAETSGGKRTSTRFISAEGCYSRAALDAQLSIKIAPKQAVGLEVPSTQQAIFIGGAVWHCSVEMQPDASLLSVLLDKSEGQRCRLSLPAVQPSIGDMQPLPISIEGCGKWIAEEWRMCAQRPAQLPKEAALYARKGVWYAQPVSSAAFVHPNGCRQNGLFHFQEWKKLWDASAQHMQVATLQPSDTLNQLAFSVSTDGIRLLPLPPQLTGAVGFGGLVGQGGQGAPGDMRTDVN